MGAFVRTQFLGYTLSYQDYSSFTIMKKSSLWRDIHTKASNFAQYFNSQNDKCIGLFGVTKRVQVSIQRRSSSTITVAYKRATITHHSALSCSLKAILFTCTYSSHSCNGEVSKFQKLMAILTFVFS